MPGRFVVLDGIDGSGTTTQTALLMSRLREDGIIARRTREPSDGPIGTTIRQVLTGRLNLSGSSNDHASWATLALLFAADRMDHIGWEIAPALRAGEVVISDRYVASSIAYQTATAPEGVKGAKEWIQTLNAEALKPDLTIVLDVPPEVASNRRDARGETEQMYERNELQTRLADFYRKLPELLPKERVVVIDGTGLPQDVHRRVITAFRDAFSSMVPPPSP